MNIEAYADGIIADFDREVYSSYSLKTFDFTLIEFKNNLLLVNKAKQALRYISNEYGFDLLFNKSEIRICFTYDYNEELVVNNFNIRPLVTSKSGKLVDRITDTLNGGSIEKCIININNAFDKLQYLMDKLSEAFD